MRGDIFPLPNTTSWRDAQLKKSTGKTLPLFLPQHITRVVWKVRGLAPVRRCYAVMPPSYITFTLIKQNYVYKWCFCCAIHTHTVGIAQSVHWLGYGLYDRGSIPGRDKELFLRHRVQTASLGPLSLLSKGYSRIFPREWSERNVKLITQLHLVRRSRMRAAIPPLLQCVFMPWCLLSTG
jgi:hypothetical protein